MRKAFRASAREGNRSPDQEVLSVAGAQSLRVSAGGTEPVVVSATRTGDTTIRIRLAFESGRGASSGGSESDRPLVCAFERRQQWARRRMRSSAGRADLRGEPCSCIT